VQQGLTAYRATGARFVLSRWLGLLAELHGRAGHLDAGRTALAEACTVVHPDGLSSFAAELYRIQGNFLLQTGAQHREGDAEASLRQALAIARQARIQRPPLPHRGPPRARMTQPLQLRVHPCTKASHTCTQHSCKNYR
jgi:hypothetical protein